MGIEPTSETHHAPDNGFEDRRRHQPPSASAKQHILAGYAYRTRLNHSHEKPTMTLRESR